MTLDLYCRGCLCCMLWFHLLWLCLQCCAGASQTWPRSCCGEQSVLPQLLGAAHTAVSVCCCFVASLGTRQDLHTQTWHKTRPGSRLRWTRDGTGTGDTSNLSAGLNAHFFPPFHLPLAEPIAWGSAVSQQTVVAFGNCVPRSIWVK